MTRKRPFMLLAALACLAAPAAAQSTANLPRLSGGEPIRVKWRGDTTWHESSVASMDRAGEVCLGAKLPPPDPADDGFILRLFSAATAIAVRDAHANWVELSEPELRELRSCGLLQSMTAAPSPGPAPDCGGAPETARGAVSGALYGMRANPDPGSPWAPFVGYEMAEIAPVQDAATCQRILSALTTARPGSSADTLPLAGILRLGDRGFVVYRSTGGQGASGRIESSQALLDGELHLLDYRRFTY